MRKSLLIPFVILISACNLVSHPTLVNPPEKTVFKPTATLDSIPRSTPTEIPPTVSPEPTIDPNFFRDDFEVTLDAGWNWVREDPRNWSLANIPGSLQINVGRGYLLSHNISNLLLRPAPAGNFQAETQLTFRPADNFQFAGLIIYESDSNFIQAGRAYCRTAGCIGEGLYMNYYRREAAVEPDFGQSYKEIDPILLRINRRGNTYTFEASTDSKVWFIIGSHTSDMNPFQIGLIAGQRFEGDTLPAVFEYFEVRSLP